MTKKVFAVFVLGLILLPSVSLAATQSTSSLQSKVASIQKQIEELQAQLASLQAKLAKTDKTSATASTKTLSKYPKFESAVHAFLSSQSDETFRAFCNEAKKVPVEGTKSVLSSDKSKLNQVPIYLDERIELCGYIINWQLVPVSPTNEAFTVLPVSSDSDILRIRKLRNNEQMEPLNELDFYYYRVLYAKMNDALSKDLSITCPASSAYRLWSPSAVSLYVPISAVSSALSMSSAKDLNITLSAREKKILSEASKLPLQGGVNLSSVCKH